MNTSFYPATPACPTATTTQILDIFGHPQRYILWAGTSWTSIPSSLTSDILGYHLEGREVVGVHPCVDGVARWGVIDIDLHVGDGQPTEADIAANETYARRKYRELRDRGIQALLIRGHCAGSYHIWFRVEMPATQLGRWLRAFAADAGMIHVDTFPSANGGGNAVRLPGRHHRRPDEWTAAWDGANWQPWPAAIDRLVELPGNSPDSFRSVETAIPPERPAPRSGSSARPGDHFNLCVSVEDVLRAYGWTVESQQEDRIYVTRPGKSSGVSASIKDGKVWVFTSSVEGLPSSTDTGRSYSAFDLLTHLQFGGNYSNAARELAKQGYGSKSQVPGSPDPSRPNSPGLPPIPGYTPFPVECLPPVVRRYVECVAASMHSDPAYSALPALACLGAAIGSSHVISPKKGWQEPPYIWALAVGRSGSGKSPPFRDVEDIAEDINDCLQMQYDAAHADYEARLQEGVSAHDAGALEAEQQDLPIKRAFKKSDVTIEALAGALEDNPRGLLIAQDEMSAWLGSFTRYSGKSGGSSLGQWLQLHHAGAINVTRKTGDRREIRVRGVGVSVSGTTQPSILARVMTEEFRAAGLFARLLLAMPPWQQRSWSEAEVDESIRVDFATLVNELYAITPGTWPDGRPCPHLVMLSETAKRLFVAFFNANGEALANAEEDMAATMSKLEGYALRFALIFHLCRRKGEGRDFEVSAADMEAAIHLTKWFCGEAERVYAVLGQTAEQRATHQLYDLVCRLAGRNTAGRHGFRGVTSRDLQKHNSRKYPTQPLAEAALESLVSAGLGEWSDGIKPSRQGGGHQPRYFVPCPTSDTSDTRWEYDIDDEEDPGDGGSDTRPDPPPPHTPDGSTAIDATSDEASVCGGNADGGHHRVSEVSDVGCSVASPSGHPGDSVAEAAAPQGECRTPVPGCCSGLTIVRVSSGDEFAQVIDALRSSPGAVGLDTETTGLNPRTDRVRLLQLAVAEKVYIVDLFEIPGATQLTPLFEALAGVEVVGHNLPFDLRFLRQLGFTPGRSYDTMLASQVLYAGRKNSKNAPLSHSLAEVAKRELNVNLNKLQQTSDWSGTLTDDQIRYAAADAAILLPLAAGLKHKLAAAKLTATAELEMRALPAVTWLGGVPVDRVAWCEQAAQSVRERDRLVGELNGIDKSPSPRNWSSTAQVNAAFVAVGIPLKSTGDDVLATIDHPLAKKLREYRAAAKRVSSYGTKWAQEHIAADDRVYAQWWQLSQVTGRIGCSKPNLQQLPKVPEIRRCIAAPPGFVLVKADYSQIELRIAAKVANEQAMRKAYQEGADLHTRTAAAILSKAEAEVTKDDRRLAKALNFGLLYGMGAEMLKVYAQTNYGVSLTLDEAKSYRAKFFATYPDLRKWQQAAGNKPRDTRTLGGRRRLRVERFTERLNSPVQGTGADGLKAAIALLWERRAECPRAVPIMYVHDEIVLEVPEDEAETANAWLKQAMLDGMTPLIDPVPVEVEVTVGQTWAGD